MSPRTGRASTLWRPAAAHRPASSRAAVELQGGTRGARPSRSSACAHRRRRACRLQCGRRALLVRPSLQRVQGRRVRPAHAVEPRSASPRSPRTRGDRPSERSRQSQSTGVRDQPLLPPVRVSPARMALAEPVQRRPIPGRSRRFQALACGAERRTRDDLPPRAGASPKAQTPPSSRLTSCKHFAAEPPGVQCWQDQ
jgi:hypothetical protein